MDSLIDFVNRANFSLWILGLICFFAYIFLRKRSLNLPPGPWGLPFLGYLPFLGSDPHLELHRLSKKYGDVFGLYIGTSYVVVVADYVTAKELLSNPSTADRPPNIFQFMPGGVGVTELNGPEWVEQRRYTMQKMKNLGFGRTPWETLVQIEVRSFVDQISQWNDQPVDIYKTLSRSVSNNVLSLVTGHPFSRDDPRRDVVSFGVESFQKIFSQSGIISFYPKLFGIAVKLGLIRARDKLESMADMNKYVRQKVEESKQEKDNHFYIHEYLKEIERNKMLPSQSSFHVMNLIGNVQSLAIAGTDTIKISLLWLFLAMASSPDKQDKVHQELDSVLGRVEEPSGWMDRLRLPYCHATILEGQRWRTVNPLNLLHRTNSDTTIRDYVIPKGSNLISMIWAFHNNAAYWTDPETFRPERFLDQDGNVIKKIENYAPFSVGKRACIGETVAYIELFLYFVGVMQRFRILPASETEPPNLKGRLGIALEPHRQPLRYVSL